MAQLVLVRHGETEWTRTNRIQGWAPVPLTNTGRDQAEAVGEYLASEFSVDRLLSSDVLRAYQTAKSVERSIDSVQSIETQTWLRERDFGLFQGLSNETARELKSIKPISDGHGPLLRDERGETWSDVDSRVQESWEALVKRVRGDTIVLVTHTGVLISVVRHLRNLPEEQADSFVFEEGSITCVRIEEGEFRNIECQNKIDHLP